MELDSVRGLKATLRQSVISPLATSLAVKSFGLQAGPTAGLPAAPPTIALGVSHAPGGKNQFVLAVRIQKRGLENSPQIESIKKQAKGEIDVQYIGVPTKRAAIPWTQKKTTPLKIGSSIGHYKITAGTLGGFVRSRDDGSVLILSNNHVLANENKGKKGDAILQPGAIDGGKNPERQGRRATAICQAQEGGNQPRGLRVGHDRLERRVRHPDAHRHGQARRPG